VSDPKPEQRIVLIADDDTDALEMLRILVEKEGHEVVSAKNGREAIEKVIDVQPDLVLLDIMMPEVDGSAVCRHIKNNDLLKRIKVVLYSAKERVQGKEIARKVGADAFLPKPFEPSTLFGILEDLLAQQDRESAKIVKKLNL
jgi:CheY-like chemotaxis protein